MKRRDFLKATATVSALAGLAAIPASAGQTGRDYYELRAYHLKDAAKASLLLNYLENAALPALNRLGIQPVGVFTEIEPKDAPTVFTLLPSQSLETLASNTLKLNADADHVKAGAEYLNATKNDPSFLRIDSWFLLSFAGMTKLELPAYSKERKARIFELRTYESPSELKAQNKVDMFNAGEIDVMHEVGLAPIFYGQALVGPNLPHLTYMTSGENLDVHKTHWDGFGAHPTWKKLIGDAKYADNVSKITKWMLKPAGFSQI